jgi:UPF0271 protein
LIKLNCDLGEGYDDVDARVMPYIDQANIACGGHAGDRSSVARTVELALNNKVAVGAHPSYPDKENFGRKSLQIAASDLDASLREQISLVAEYSALHHIKAHGALYNDCATNLELVELLVKLAKNYNCKLMIQAFPNMDAYRRVANKYGIELITETFADRAYSDDGRLVPRTEKGAVYTDENDIINQALALAYNRSIQTITNHALKIESQSLCVHGDNPLAFDALKKIRHALR